MRCTSWPCLITYIPKVWMPRQWFHTYRPIQTCHNVPKILLICISQSYIIVCISVVAWMHFTSQWQSSWSSWSSLSSSWSCIITCISMAWMPPTSLMTDASWPSSSYHHLDLDLHHHHTSSWSCIITCISIAWMPPTSLMTVASWPNFIFQASRITDTFRNNL